MTIEIKLTRGKMTVIDDADLPLVSRYKWRVMPARSGDFHAITSLPKKGPEHEKSILLHRLLLDAKPGQDVDHRDGNGLNNRRSNIRLATKAENTWNRRRLVLGKSSRFKGVSFCKNTKKWRAQIRYQGKSIQLGRFEKEEDAAAAYDLAANELFGSFAAINGRKPGKK